jgi:hypothetical protein
VCSKARLHGAGGPPCLQTGKHKAVRTDTNEPAHSVRTLQRHNASSLSRSSGAKWSAWMQKQHMEHTNTLCGLHAVFPNVQAGGTYSSHCHSNG